MAKIKGTDVSLFTLGLTEFIGVLQNATITTTVGDEDGSAINEINEDPEPVSRARTISGMALVEDVAGFTAIAEGANPVVAFVLNSGANTYSGNALITSAGHEMKKKGLQSQQFTLKVKGVMTVVVPGGGA